MCKDVCPFYCRLFLSTSTSYKDAPMHHHWCIGVRCFLVGVCWYFDLTLYWTLPLKYLLWQVIEHCCDMIVFNSSLCTLCYVDTYPEADPGACLGGRQFPNTLEEASVGGSQGWNPSISNEFFSSNVASSLKGSAKVMHSFFLPLHRRHQGFHIYGSVLVGRLPLRQCRLDNRSFAWICSLHAWRSIGAYVFSRQIAWATD